MLTARRSELSKYVRQAKKDHSIQKYSVDQNGKIFVVKIGSTDFKEVKSIYDIDQLKSQPWTSSSFLNGKKDKSRIH